MTGDGGPAYRQGIGQLLDRSLAAGQELDDGPAVGVTEGGERIGFGGHRLRVTRACYRNNMVTDSTDGSR